MEYLEGLRSERIRIHSEIEERENMLSVIDSLISNASAVPQKLVVLEAVDNQVPMKRERNGNLEAIKKIIKEVIQGSPGGQAHNEQIEFALATHGVELDKRYLANVLTRHFKSIKKGSGFWRIKGAGPSEELDFEENEPNEVSTPEVPASI